MSTRAIASLMLFVPIALGVEIDSASARIQCDGAYQVSGRGRIATPYCEDAYLANVARQYGTRVSAETVRQNPIEKARICQFVGNDIRVKDICAGHQHEGDIRR